MTAILVTAEHGGRDVPVEHRALFADADALLSSHRGWDPGSLVLARDLGERLDAPVVTATVTRLLVDLNRSPHNPRVFSELTRLLPRERRVELLERWHRPHWESVGRALVELASKGGARVLHLGIHTFTPVLDGVPRRPDLALLYDPGRAAERALAARWASFLGERVPGRVVGRNDPYRGKADGLTTALRRRRPDSAYLGIEIEVSQRHLGDDGAFPDWVAEALVRSLRRALGERVTV